MDPILGKAPLVRLAFGDINLSIGDITGKPLKQLLMSRLVRAACLTHYADVARAHGLDPWQQLREAGLPAACLGNPDLRISVEAVRQLLEHSATRAGTEAFGLLMAEGRRVSNLGVLGLLLREEPTLRHALQSVVSYGRVHNEALLQRLDEAGGIVTIHEELLLGSPGPTRQATELVVAVALRLMRFFLGADWRARRVCFMHSPPLSLAVHRRVLGQTPEFSSDFNGIVCTSADLDTPLASADPVVADFLRQQLLHPGPPRVSDEVRQMVLLLLPRGRCSIEQVSRLMGITRRTLHRQLAAEQAIFRDLVQAVRLELAPRYLSDPDRPLTDISQLLGFADLSSFSRWHRQHRGHSPRQARGLGDLI